MVVRRIKGELWIDVYVRQPGRKPRRLRRRSPVQTQKGAAAFERQTLEQEYSLGGRTARTVADFAIDDFANYCRANNSSAEYDRKEKAMRGHLLPAFGELYLADVQQRDIDAYKAAKAHLAPKTIANHLSVLRKLLALAKEYGDLAEVPKIQMPRIPDTAFDFLTFDEADRVVAAADEGQWRTMILVAVRSGLRIGELRALRWENVDLVRGAIHVRENATILGKTKAPKNLRFRHVPIGPETVAALKAHRHLRGDFVFCKEDGAMLLEHECKHPCKRASKRAGIGRIVYWHVFRHTFASHLAMRGVPLKAIQELLGHSSMTMTNRYAHLAPAVLSDVVKMLEEPAPKWSLPGS